MHLLEMLALTVIILQCCGALKHHRLFLKDIEETLETMNSEQSDRKNPRTYESLATMKLEQNLQEDSKTYEDLATMNLEQDHREDAKTYDISETLETMYPEEIRPENPRPYACTATATFGTIDYSMMGYNILYGYPMSTGKDPGFVLPIFSIELEPPIYTSDCGYLVPHGLYVVAAVSCVTTFQASEAKNEEEFSSVLGNEVTTGAGGWGVKFTASTEYQTSVYNMNSLHNVYIFSTAKCQYYYARLDEISPPPLHPNFITAVKYLETHDDAATYFAFFENYGTHIIKDITYGSRYTEQYEMTEKQYNTASESSFSVTTQAEYAGTFSVSGGFGMSEDEKAAAEEFSKNSKSTTITVGALPPADGDALAWASSVKELPMPMKVSLKSIEGMFNQRYFEGVDVDYKSIKNSILKYKAEYCKHLVDIGEVKSCLGVESICKPKGDGPHRIWCLRLWWVSAGCSLEHGLSSPDNDDAKVAWWNTKTVQEVLDDMHWTFQMAMVYYDVDDYRRCHGSWDECPLSSPGPHKPECLRNWWLNTGCSLAGTFSPTYSSDVEDAYNTRTGDEVRKDMTNIRVLASAPKWHELYGRCFETRAECPLDGHGPHERDCLRYWWENSGCLLGGTASPNNDLLQVAEWNELTVDEVRKSMNEFYTAAQNYIYDYEGYESEILFEKCYGIIGIY